MTQSEAIRAFSSITDSTPWTLIEMQPEFTRHRIRFVGPNNVDLAFEPEFIAITVRTSCTNPEPSAVAFIPYPSIREMAVIYAGEDNHKDMLIILDHKGHVLGEFKAYRMGKPVKKEA